jgi:VWFA-related protein
MRPLACALALVAAQQGASPQAPAPPAFRSGIELVRLDVSVMRGGRPVQGLTARDFVVLDNGVEQEIESAALDRLPLDVQLVLDASDSVSGARLAHLLAAATGLLHELRTGDRVGLLTFSDALQVRAAMTGDVASVGAILPAIAGSGQTALRDAVAFGIALRREGATRPLMLVFTDGIDNASWLTSEAAIDSARRAGIVTHVVRVRGREPSSSRFVEDLTEATGGRIWSASSERDLEVLFAEALEEMRARYVLSFSPKGAGGSGWHELDVKLRRGGADIASRPGYFVSR